MASQIRFGYCSSPRLLAGGWLWPAAFCFFCFCWFCCSTTSWGVNGATAATDAQVTELRKKAAGIMALCLNVYYSDGVELDEMARSGNYEFQSIEASNRLRGPAFEVYIDQPQLQPQPGGLSPAHREANAKYRTLLSRIQAMHTVYFELEHIKRAVSNAIY